MRTALVTGGTRRLGRAIADRLRADGWRVLTSSHRADAGADFVADLAERALGYRAISVGQMARVRETSDALEDIVSKAAWPYPSYGNLLYRV